MSYYGGMATRLRMPPNAIFGENWGEQCQLGICGRYPLTGDCMDTWPCRGTTLLQWRWQIHRQAADGFLMRARRECIDRHILYGRFQKTGEIHIHI